MGVKPRVILLGAVVSPCLNNRVGALHNADGWDLLDHLENGK